MKNLKALYVAAIFCLVISSCTLTSPTSGLTCDLRVQRDSAVVLPSYVAFAHFDNNKQHSVYAGQVSVNNTSLKFLTSPDSSGYYYSDRPLEISGPFTWKINGNTDFGNKETVVTQGFPYLDKPFSMPAETFPANHSITFNLPEAKNCTHFVVFLPGDTAGPSSIVEVPAGQTSYTIPEIHISNYREGDHLKVMLYW